MHCDICEMKYRREEEICVIVCRMHYIIFDVGKK